MKRTHDALEVISVIYRQGYKLGFIESDGHTLKDQPIKGDMTHPEYSAACGYAEGWSSKTWLVNEGRDQ
jgi:hypothetical protein